MLSLMANDSGVVQELALEVLANLLQGGSSDTRCAAIVSVYGK